MVSEFERFQGPLSKGGLKIFMLARTNISLCILANIEYLLFSMMLSLGKREQQQEEKEEEEERQQNRRQKQDTQSLNTNPIEPERVIIGWERVIDMESDLFILRRRVWLKKRTLQRQHCKELDMIRRETIVRRWEEREEDEARRTEVERRTEEAKRREEEVRRKDAEGAKRYADLRDWSIGIAFFLASCVCAAAILGLEGMVGLLGFGE